MNRTRPQPLIIPVFIPHRGCPHRCVFCNQNTIAGTRIPLPTICDEVAAAVERFTAYGRNRCGRRQIAFFGGNFLGLADEQVLAYLTAAQLMVDSGRIDGIRFSTRPDTLDSRRLRLLRGYRVQTVEIGAQSMDDRVLSLAGRGHSSDQTREAAAALREIGCEVGLQMMVGLPGEGPNGAENSARTLAGLKPDFVRIYPTVVLRGSALAGQYRSGAYRPLPLDEAVSRVKSLYLLFQQRGIPVVRMGLQASENLDGGKEVVAGPYHPAFGHMVHAALFLEMARRLLAAAGPLHRRAVFRLNPRSISRAQGLCRSNISVLCKAFSLAEVTLRQDPEIPEDGLVLEDSGGTDYRQLGAGSTVV